MVFDEARAKAAGYSDEEIAEFLAQQGSVPASESAPLQVTIGRSGSAAPQDFDEAEALASGYTREQIEQFKAQQGGAATLARRDFDEAGAKAAGYSDEEIAEFKADLEPKDFLRETLGNVPRSAMELAEGLAQPFLHPIQTAQSLGEVGAGVLAKVGIGDGDETAANAVGEFMAERYGGVDNLLNTIKTDPVGFMADASVLLTAGGGLAARLPGIAGRVGQAAATAGRVVDPIANTARLGMTAGRAAGAVAAPLFTNALGLATGAGGRAVGEAARAGYAGGPLNDVFLAHMRGQAPVEDVVAVARDALRNMASERSAAYQAGIQGTAAATQTIPFTDIDRAVSAVRGRGFFGTQPINPAAAQAWGELDDLVTTWRGLDPQQYHTPVGFDAMKRAVGSIRDGLPYGTPGRGAADAVYNAVKKEIVDQVPKYARVMRDYERASSGLQELEKTFSLGNKTAIDTSMRKLQAIFRNNANTNYGRRAELGARLVDSGATGLNEMLAGQALSSATPRGLQGALAGAGWFGLALSNPTALPALAATSPRLVGEAANAAGRVGGVAARAGRAAEGLYTPYRAGLANATAQLQQALSEKYADEPQSDFDEAGAEAAGYTREQIEQFRAQPEAQSESERLSRLYGNPR